MPLPTHNPAHAWDDHCENQRAQAARDRDEALRKLNMTDISEAAAAEADIRRLIQSLNDSADALRRDLAAAQAFKLSIAEGHVEEAIGCIDAALRDSVQIVADLIEEALAADEGAG